MRLACWILAGALVLSGCGERLIPDAVEVADSAGVRIVVNHMADVPTWDISRDPVLELGTLDGGPEEFFQVAGATRLSDGRLVVLNAGSREIRVFSNQGAFLHAFGEAGSGPGEFRFPSGLFRLAGDSLAVWDSGPGRLSVFTPQGAFARAVSPATLNPTPLAALPDGSMIFTSDQFDFSDGPAFRMMYTEFLLVGPEGEIVESLPSQPLGEFGAYGETGMMGTPLFGSRTWSAGAENGYWVGTTDSEEIRRYSARGDLEMIVRWPPTDRATTDRDAELELQKELADASVEDVARLRAIHAARPVASRFPSHGVLHVDTLGWVWVQEYERPNHAGPSIWKVFREDGVLSATVALPAGHRILEVGNNYVLTVGIDELEVEYVRMFELVRSP